MSHTSPRISVVVPTYNRSSALSYTLQSVADQTFGDFELIVVDDGSTDDTGAVAQAFGDPRLRYERQENQGVAAARNRGLALARGEYLAFLDHDDRWAPEKLELQCGYLDRQSECGVVYSAISLIDDAGTDQGHLELPAVEGEVFGALLTRHNFVFTMSNPLLRTELVRQVGGLDPGADISDDWDLFLRLAKVTRFGRIELPLVRYNVGNPASQTRDPFRVYRSERGILSRYVLGSRELPASVRGAAVADFRRRFAPAFRERAWHMQRAGRVGGAWRCYLEAVRLCPGYLLDVKMLKDVVTLLRLTVRAKGVPGVEPLR